MVEKFELEKWNKAKQAIVEAKSIDEVKSIIDKAEAMRVYAKQIGESLDVQNDVAEIKLRAQRRAGEMLKETELIGRGGGDTRSESMPSTRFKLKEIGVSKDDSSKWQRISNIKEGKFESLIQEIKDEGKELTTAFMVDTAKKIDRATKIAEQEKGIKEGTIKLPEGKFQVIVIDPPWNYGRVYDPQGSRVANPYPEMTIDQLQELQIQSDDNCIMWLWTTHQFMWEAKKLLEHWGFEYKAAMVWDKENMGMGAWLRMQCEFCLMGIKGKPLWKGTAVRDIIREQRTTHSTKPESFYKIVEDNCIGRKLEYFGRKKREGWDVFGAEIKN